MLYFLSRITNMIKDKYIPRASERENHNWCVPYATAVVTGRDYDEVYKVFNDTLPRRGLVKGVKTTETHLVADKYGIDLKNRYAVNRSHGLYGRINGSFKYKFNIINVHGYDGVYNIRNINKVVTALHNTKDYMEDKMSSGDWWIKEDSLWSKIDAGYYSPSSGSPRNKWFYDKWMETPAADYKSRYYFVRISGHMMVYDYEKDLIIDNYSKKWESPNDHVHRLKRIKELIPVIYTNDFVPVEPSPRPTGVSEKARLKKLYYNRVRRLCKKNGIKIVMNGKPKNWTSVSFYRVDPLRRVAKMTPKTNKDNWTPDWKVAYESLKRFGWK